MARSLNKIMVIGNLGQDPDIRYPASGDGRAFGTLSVATEESWFSREKNQEESRTEWHRVRLFAGLAEVAEKFLHKGDRVYIEGRLQTRSYEKDGDTRYVTEIVAREMLMLGGRDAKGGNYDDAGQGDYARGGGGAAAGAGAGQARGGAPAKAGGGAPAKAGGGAPAPTDAAAADSESFDNDLPF